MLEAEIVDLRYLRNAGEGTDSLTGELGGAGQKGGIELDWKGILNF